MRRLAHPCVLILALAACGASDQPIQGKKRGELCAAVEHPAAFACPPGTSKRGNAPPEGQEMWCQNKEGARHGPYRRFPTGATPASEPAYVGDGIVVGEYKDDRQHGAWWTPRAGAPAVTVSYYESGELAQRIQCQR